MLRVPPQGRWTLSLCRDCDCKIANVGSSRLSLPAINMEIGLSCCLLRVTFTQPFCRSFLPVWVVNETGTRSPGSPFGGRQNLNFEAAANFLCFLTPRAFPLLRVGQLFEKRAAPALPAGLWAVGTPGSTSPRPQKKKYVWSGRPYSRGTAVRHVAARCYR